MQLEGGLESMEHCYRSLLQDGTLLPVSPTCRGLDLLNAALIN